MPTLIGYHEIKDAQHWLASPKREELFGPIGITNIRTFVDPQNPTRAALLMDVPDMEAFQAAMQTQAVPVRGRGRRDGGARRGRASQRLGSAVWSSGRSLGH